MHHEKRLSDVVEGTTSSLLHKPTPSSSTSHKQKREYTEHVALSKELFLLSDKTFTQQFSKLYEHRIKTLKPPLLKKISKLYPKATHAKSMLDLSMGVEYTVVGTLYKEMKLKPNILREFTLDKTASEVAQIENRNNYVSNDDYLILEDVNGSRCNVIFEGKQSEKNKIMTNQLVTGIVAGLFGEIDSNGTFIARDIVFNDMAPQNALVSNSKDAYLAVLSGICVGHPKFDAVATQLAFDFITGLATSGALVNNVVAKISRVIIAGNVVIAPEDQGKLFDVRGSLRPKELSSIAEFMRTFDILVEQLASNVDVDILPGSNDPSNVTIPQQPIHPYMFPKSASYSTCHLVTNPHIIRENHVDVVVTSGQTVEDVEKYSVYNSRLDIMENMLKWGHLAPTSPDTMRCYPFQQVDPFIIKNTPHVFVCGNCSKFETKLLEFEHARTRLVCVPEFVTQPTIVLINLRTLGCFPVNFSTEHVI
ncbi:hypothetical protein FDP41_003226 [Naegleria fowleri]|uniref:DNA polymerase delta small subunit n=1 Tax=Naegleria fowleri TaxID=5763 RepID=A0A6A5BUG3_NAEFO|nr:uncharacterized protein FDP41_003226 [Naegleria fowleri]KAF0977904.1 hypothetical protein FDP41_003226 [Naegleria fowleri]